MHLRNIQNEYLNYLLAKPSGIEEMIVSSNGWPATARLDLYADAYRLRLKEALATDYEQLGLYLGDTRFDTLMQTYIDCYPSHTTNLRYYSQQLPDLLRKIDPWRQSPELSEIASIEKAFCDSFDSADGTTVQLTQLAQIDPEQWSTLTVTFHDSVQLLSFEYNSFTLWQALSAGESLPALEAQPSNWVVWRDGLDINYSTITADETRAMQTMMSGGNFADVCTTLLEVYSDEDVPVIALGYLQEWITSKMVAALVDIHKTRTLT